MIMVSIMIRDGWYWVSIISNGLTIISSMYIVAYNHIQWPIINHYMAYQIGPQWTWEVYGKPRGSSSYRLAARDGRNQLCLPFRWHFPGHVYLKSLTMGCEGLDFCHIMLKRLLYKRKFTWLLFCLSWVTLVIQWILEAVYNNNHCDYHG